MKLRGLNLLRTISTPCSRRWPSLVSPRKRNGRTLDSRMMARSSARTKPKITVSRERETVQIRPSLKRSMYSQVLSKPAAVNTGGSSFYLSRIYEKAANSSLRSRREELKVLQAY